MCRALNVHRSGYYAWKAEPLSARAIEDVKLLIEIKQSYEDSQGIYGSPRVQARVTNSMALVLGYSSK